MVKGMKYAVFLDFDGVLTTGRVDFANNGRKDRNNPMWHKFDPVAVDFLNRIHDTFEGVRFVWTTTWRTDQNFCNDFVALWAATMFANAGFRGLFAEEPLVNGNHDTTLYKDRGREIQDYLDLFQPRDYLVFDDDRNYDFTMLPRKRVVYTDPLNGMLLEHMKYAWGIVGNWDRKDD